MSDEIQEGPAPRKEHRPASYEQDPTSLRKQPNRISAWVWIVIAVPILLTFSCAALGFLAALMVTRVPATPANVPFQPAQPIPGQNRLAIP